MKVNNVRHILVLVMLVMLFGCTASSQHTPGNPGLSRIPSDPSLSSTTETVLLTGSAARQVSGPLGAPQRLSDCTNTVLNAWGPVQSVLHVAIGSQLYVVNRLCSPDPFTATYQMPDSRILVTNDPVEYYLIDPNYDPPKPPIVQWTDPDSVVNDIYDGRAQVYFRDTATEADISAFLAAHDVHVIMSWFEPSVNTGGGNEIAYFELSYGLATYPTFDDIFTAFNANPLVGSIGPIYTDDCAADYGDRERAFSLVPPEDYYYALGGECLYTNLTHVNTNGRVAVGPECRYKKQDGSSYPFSTQVVAVLDTGVWRGHPDFMLPNNKNKISGMGVNVRSTSYDMGPGLGEPDPAVQEQSTLYPEFGYRCLSHGTSVAGIITAGTYNDSPSSPYDGYVVGLAPNTCVLPMRLPVGANGKCNETAIVTAARILRFEFYASQDINGDKWLDRVRVVNLSFSSPEHWTDRFPDKYSQKWNINRDCYICDRLWVAASGNKNLQTLHYPAAYDCVLGVSGVKASVYDSGNITIDEGKTGDMDNGNYWINGPSHWNIYTVSGYYNVYSLRAKDNYHYNTLGDAAGEIFYQRDPRVEFGFTTCIPWSNYPSNNCLPFGGTSAACPQVAALAQQLFDIRPTATHMQVWQHIYNNRINDPNNPIVGRDFTRHPGLLNFDCLWNW
jgi:hypothetical protein